MSDSKVLQGDSLKLLTLRCALDDLISDWRYRGKAVNANDADLIYDECAQALISALDEANEVQP